MPWARVPKWMEKKSISPLLFNRNVRLTIVSSKVLAFQNLGTLTNY